MKRGPFPPGAFCCTPISGTTTRPDCRSAAPPLPGFAGYRRASLPVAPQATGPRRLSPVPRTTVRTFNAQYAGGFLGARSRFRGAFHGLRRGRTGSAPSLSRPRAGRLTTLARASLTLQTARSHRPRFAPDLSATHGGLATGDPGISPDRTFTGGPPRACRLVTSSRIPFPHDAQAAGRTRPRREGAAP